LKAQNKSLKSDIEALAKKHETLSRAEQTAAETLAGKKGMVKELVGVIRVNAKDIDSLLSKNLQTAIHGAQPSYLASVAEKSKFPGMEDVRDMAEALFGQIRQTGAVTIKKGTMIDRTGKSVEADILALGPFSAAYRKEGETGFLNYTSGSGKLYALSRLLSGRMQDQITEYMNGESKAVPIDITRGAVLRQLTHELNLWEMVPKGGLLIWPILTILAVGLLIVLERVIFLARKRLDTSSLVNRIESLAHEKKWQECSRACAGYAGKPVARVLQAGLQTCHMQREEMENALQEAILREIPPMERFLSTLGMLAAIAPLLGLLGTVTGMIDTFHVITLHGTGDPRLMSGGISEALVTTMLGLSVAIPLMLSQTLLNRSVDKTIGQMEEKAVALVNIVYKSRGTL
jgi:biopolymer transport protein ExbB